MTMTVSFLRTTRDGQEVVGELELHDGKLFINAPEESQDFFQGIIDRREEGESLEAWFEALPDLYHGSMFCAVRR